MFAVSVVFCNANTTEMSDNVNGWLLILIRRLLMFIKLRLFARNEYSRQQTDIEMLARTANVSAVIFSISLLVLKMSLYFSSDMMNLNLHHDP